MSASVAYTLLRRSDALVEAEELCEVRTLEARILYADTVRHARERFEAETATALAAYRRAVMHMQRDYNRAVVHIETGT
ncbi:MAG TPA: hypothetical protein VKQ07_03410 [Jatrophihabitantaceae bacterium]|nr:hypothetical protein [Jatrophihabitantaceae bacterium]